MIYLISCIKLRWHKLMYAKLILQLHLLRAFRQMWDERLVGTKVFVFLMRIVSRKR